jgi:zinc transporter
MTVDRDLSAGAEPGLRFAAVIRPDGKVKDLTWADLALWKPEDGFIWVHLERDDPVAQTWIREQSGIDPLAAETLLAEDSRPRVQDIGDDMLIVLRGVNRTPPESSGERALTDLVPVHIWAEATRCISLRDKAHALDALRDIRRVLLAGKGPRTIGNLLALIAEKMVDHLGDVIDELEEAMSDLEEKICEDQVDSSLRQEISVVRRGVVQLRRYLSPQRDALYRLQHDDASWLDDNARYRLRDVSDRLARHIDDIDEIRSRATILNEDFTNILNERATGATSRLTALAALILPPSLVAALLGANVGGIPGADHPYAFLWLCALLAGITICIWGVLKWLKWL